MTPLQPRAEAAVHFGTTGCCLTTLVIAFSLSSLFSQAPAQNLEIVALPNPAALIRQSAVAKDGSLLATSTAADEVTLWDAKTGSQLHTFLPTPGRIVAMAIGRSPDTLVVASGREGDWEPTVTVVDLGTYSPICDLRNDSYAPNPNSYATFVDAVGISPNSKYIGVVRDFVS